MDTAAWVGAIEVALGLLYAALIGQRSIAQWFDDRRKTRPASDAVELPPETSAPDTTPRSRPRLLSVQRVGAYVEYFWHDPHEAVLATGKALGLGSVLLFGAAALLLLTSALVTVIAVSLTGNPTLDRIAGQMSNGGGVSFFLASGGGVLAFFATWGLESLAKKRQSEKEEQERLERIRAEAKAAAKRRRNAGQ
jgi:hypothetical protein